MFGPQVWIGKRYIRNQYIYIGRTTPGQLVLESATVGGTDADRFRVYYPKTTANSGEWIRIKVEYSAFEKLIINKLDAYIEIRTAPGRVRRVQIGWEKRKK